MNISPTDLLRQLGSGVRPDGVTPTHATTPIDSASFGEMLDRVKQGQVSSSRPITVAANLAKSLTLSDAQLAQVATATDAAEAAGATRIMAVVGGQALLVDVQTRTVEAATALSQARLVTGVDAVVMVPDDPTAQLTNLFSPGVPVGGALGLAGKAMGGLAGLSGTTNQSVAALLASLGAQQDEPRERTAA